MTQEIDIAALRKAAHDCTTTAKLDAMATSACIRLFNKLASAKNILALLDRLEQAEMAARIEAQRGDELLAKLEQAEKGAELYRHVREMTKAAGHDSITEALVALGKAEKDAARMEWYFGEADKGPWMNTYLQGCREGWTVDQWRASISAAMQGEGA